MPQITGILETALTVDDLVRAADFYRKLFGFKVLLENPRLVALNVAERSVLLLFPSEGTEKAFTTPGGVVPGHGASGRSHLAFSIPTGDVAAWNDKLLDEGIAVESMVTWPGGAKSIYFRDPDEHLVELMTPGFWKLT